MNVTLRQLRAFAALAQTASFTEAATTLFVTQSALSGLIRELEAALGVQLVQRSTRKVSLSEAGREFYPLAQKILQDLDGALDTIADIKALKRGVVRIAAPQLLSCSVLPDVMAGFAKENPDIEVRLADCMVEAVQSKVRSGEVDFGVGPERDASADVAASLLFEMPFVVVFPPGHALHACAQVSWEDALSHPMIALQGEFTQRLRGDLQLGQREVSFGPVREVGFMTSAFAMVRAGLGVTTCLPYANTLISLHGLESRPLIEPQVQRKFFVFTRKDRSLSPAARCFEAYLLAFVQRQGWCGQAA
jgi:DNA-binding transcriptional LysR family regulator